MGPENETKIDKYNDENIESYKLLNYIMGIVNRNFKIITRIIFLQIDEKLIVIPMDDNWNNYKNHWTQT